MKSHPPVFGQVFALKVDAEHSKEPWTVAPMTKGTFAAVLKEHRERLGITQANMAHILGVSTRCYSQWETYHTGTHPLKMAGVIEKLRRLPAE